MITVSWVVKNILASGVEHFSPPFSPALARQEVRAKLRRLFPDLIEAGDNVLLDVKVTTVPESTAELLYIIWGNAQNWTFNDTNIPLWHDSAQKQAWEAVAATVLNLPQPLSIVAAKPGPMKSSILPPLPPVPKFDITCKHGNAELVDEWDDTDDEIAWSNVYHVMKFECVDCGKQWTETR